MKARHMIVCRKVQGWRQTYAKISYIAMIFDDDCIVQRSLDFAALFSM